MKHLFMSDSFISRIESLCENNKLFSNVYKKVKGKLRNYAVSIETPIDQLRIIQVADDWGKLNKKLIKYINALPEKSKESVKIKKYRGEILSMIKRLVSGIFAESKAKQGINKDTDISDGSRIEQQLPKWMLPLLDELPRGDNKNSSLKSRNFEIYRKQPLSENSLLLLDSLLKVALRNNLQHLKNLLIDNCAEIYLELKKTNSRSQFRTLQQIVYKTQDGLGFKRIRVERKVLSFEQWSNKFQKQWKIYEKYAEQGLPNNNLAARLAIRFKVSIKPVTKGTISSYKKSLEWGLYHCHPLPKNWGIEDLMVVQSRTTVYAGIEHQETYNEIIDRYRIREQDQEREAKRVGYDSSCFGYFKMALKAIAAFNSFAHLVGPFNKAYNIKLDEDSKNLRKANKKKQYSIKEIDENIARLEKEFNQIVKNRSFARRQGVSFLDSDKDMRLCLFYPMLLIFRFLGLRQRNVRNCRIMQNPENPDQPDGNIGFRRDGTIIFHFAAEETKNKKPLHFEFNLKDHKTHGFLIRGLTTYFEKVYPYIQKNAVNSLEDQFFVYSPRKRGKFARFPDNRACLYILFTTWRDGFLKFRQSSEQKTASFHPHFLRGICADWLVRDLHLNSDQVAEYIGDDSDTLEKHYFDKNRTYDATIHITNANKMLDEIADKNGRGKAVDTQNAENLATLTVQLQRLQDRLDKNDEIRIELQEELLKKNDSIDSLSSEISRLKNLLTENEQQPDQDDEN